MGSNLAITKEIENYISNHSLELTKVQKEIISSVISKNQDQVAQYKSGKEKLFGYFVGEVMKASKGKANPQLVNEILKKKLH